MEDHCCPVIVFVKRLPIKRGRTITGWGSRWGSKTSNHANLADVRMLTDFMMSAYSFQWDWSSRTVNYSETNLRVCNPRQFIDLFIGSLPGFLEKSLSPSSNYCHEARIKELCSGEPALNWWRTVTIRRVDSYRWNECEISSQSILVSIMETPAAKGSRNGAPRPIWKVQETGLRLLSLLLKGICRPGDAAKLRHDGKDVDIYRWNICETSSYLI